MTTTDTTVTVETLRDWLEQGRALTLLDVRPATECAEWSVPGSLNVDAYDRLKAGDPTALAALDLPADRPVVTICAAGRTSLIAAEQLRARGLEALSLEGGMRAWSLAWNTAEGPYPAAPRRCCRCGAPERAASPTSLLRRASQP
jgi:rhodanese-related sulfurtransferase